MPSLMSKTIRSFRSATSGGREAGLRTARPAARHEVWPIADIAGRSSEEGTIERGIALQSGFSPFLRRDGSIMNKTVMFAAECALFASLAFAAARVPRWTVRAGLREQSRDQRHVRNP